MSVNEWREVNISDAILTSNTGLDAIKRAPIVDYNSGIKCLRIQDISQNKDFKDWGFCAVEAKNYSKFQLKKGDIIVARTGATIGVNKLIKKDLESVFNNGLIRIRINSDKIDGRYLYYNMQGNSYKGHIQAISGGTSTQPNMKMNALLDFKINLPSLTEQKAIACTLSCIDDKIELNNRMNKNYEEMAQAIFKNWFVDFEPFQEGEFENSELGMIPKGWKAVELGDISKFSKGKKPKKLMETRSSDSLAQYLTIDALNGGISIFADVEKMVLANTYDVLMVMDGASSGAVHFGLNGVVGSTIAKLDVNNELVKEVVYQYLKANESEIKSHNTGSAIPHTDKGYVSRCKIAIPQDEELREISKSLKELRGMIVENRLQSKRLMDIRDSLLPKLMSGEIRIPIDEVQ